MNDVPLWDLPSGWCWTEAGQLIEDISAGKSFKCDERPPQQGEVGVVKVSAVTWGSYDEQESKTCTSAELVNPELFIHPGDFLFSRANTIELVGACVIADRVTRDVMLSDKILRFSVRDGWKKWLLWALRSSHGRAEIERLATGNQDSMRNIGQPRVRSIRVPLPANGEQERIVEAIESHFSRLDDAVATLERVERNLKRYRASVLKAAVEGRLVPNEAALAKQEGRRYEPASILLDRILAERRRRWSESGKKGKYQEPTPPDTANLPDLPEGWCWATVDQLGESITGTTPATAKPEYYGGDLPFFKPTDLDAGYSVTVARDCLSELGARQARVLPIGSILVTCIGATIGKVGLARVECATNQQINALVPDPPLRDVFFLFWFFASPFGQSSVIENASSTTMPILNKSRFERLTVPVPPLCEQARIVAEVERLFALIDSAETERGRAGRKCVRLRQSILKRAFEGKLVDQDPNDEPASVLLERIKAERSNANPAEQVRPPRDTEKKKLRA